MVMFRSYLSLLEGGLWNSHTLNDGWQWLIIVKMMDDDDDDDDADADDDDFYDYIPYANHGAGICSPIFTT